MQYYEKYNSYRIEKAIAINTLNNVNLQNEITMYKQIIHAVDIHRKAIKFIALFFSGCDQSRMALIMFAVICLSFNLYGISEAILFGDFQQFIIHFLLVLSIFVYGFAANYAGQELINHNNRIFSTAYNVRWYIAPLHIQKLILFLLQRGTKTVSLNIGGMFVLSVELFGMLVKASISYFTVICSMEH
ncbi:uncharacterized protein LOC105425591 [Pogonomyrmex barbatus]|uniref:Uncharacterized protein LOC105425591 n=1 Tax=Pogonomyrmex barbatus TaxID=144034 RepID=A0A6I9W152_9HYME|nr:uncharacterized protein LOC105425591 [Pogonomyrmex barbatus]